jgi:hypothetical protein
VHFLQPTFMNNLLCELILTLTPITQSKILPSTIENLYISYTAASFTQFYLGSSSVYHSAKIIGKMPFLNIKRLRKYIFDDWMLKQNAKPRCGIDKNWSCSQDLMCHALKVKWHNHRLHSILQIIIMYWSWHQSDKDYCRFKFAGV